MWVCAGELTEMGRLSPFMFLSLRAALRRATPAFIRRCATVLGLRAYNLWRSNSLRFSSLYFYLRALERPAASRLRVRVSVGALFMLRVKK